MGRKKILRCTNVKLTIAFQDDDEGHDSFSNLRNSDDEIDSPICQKVRQILKWISCMPTENIFI